MTSFDQERSKSRGFATRGSRSSVRRDELRSASRPCGDKRSSKEEILRGKGKTDENRIRHSYTFVERRRGDTEVLQLMEKVFAASSRAVVGRLAWPNIKFLLAYFSRLESLELRVLLPEVGGADLSEKWSMCFSPFNKVRVSRRRNSNVPVVYQKNQKQRQSQITSTKGDVF